MHVSLRRRPARTIPAQARGMTAERCLSRRPPQHGRRERLLREGPRLYAVAANAPKAEPPALAFEVPPPCGPFGQSGVVGVIDLDHLHQPILRPYTVGVRHCASTTRQHLLNYVANGATRP